MLPLEEGAAHLDSLPGLCRYHAANGHELGAHGRIWQVDAVSLLGPRRLHSPQIHGPVLAVLLHLQQRLRSASPAHTGEARCLHAAPASGPAAVCRHGCLHWCVQVPPHVSPHLWLQCRVGSQVKAKPPHLMAQLQVAQEPSRQPALRQTGPGLARDIQKDLVHAQALSRAKPLQHRLDLFAGCPVGRQVLPADQDLQSVRGLGNNADS